MEKGLNGAAAAGSPPSVQPLARIADLIDKALKGELPRERSPHTWEPQVLTPVHVQMVLDRAMGFQLKEIAERWDYTAAQVANVLAQPDAQTILSTILSMQADKLVSMEDRFAALAPEALNVKVEILRNPEASPLVRDRVASDLLDRAGYGPRKKLDIDTTHRILLPAQAATGLRAVLEESRRVASVDYSRFLQKPGGEVAGTHLQLEAGHLKVADGASPVPSSGPGEPIESTEAPVSGASESEKHTDNIQNTHNHNELEGTERFDLGPIFQSDKSRVA